MLSYFQGMGTGWSPAVLNDRMELDFIRQGQRGFSDTKSYWIGGSTYARPFFNLDYSAYFVGDSGDLRFLIWTSSFTKHSSKEYFNNFGVNIFFCFFLHYNLTVLLSFPFRS